MENRKGLCEFRNDKKMCVLTVGEDIKDLQYFAELMSRKLSNCNVYDVKIVSNVKKGFFGSKIIYSAFIFCNK
jgi:hypothetical protein